MKRVAIVDCGSIAKVHAENLSAMDNLKITAVCDVVFRCVEALVRTKTLLKPALHLKMVLAESFCHYD